MLGMGVKVGWYGMDASFFRMIYVVFELDMGCVPNF
jgi:hypothetical protein